MWPTPAAFTLQRITKRKKVLVVDRDEAILHLCGYLIIQNGLSEYTCQDLYNAFRALSNLDFDLVVTGIEFPTHDGIDLTHYIRTNFPHIQVIVMTPFGDTASAVKAIRAGATDYLSRLLKNA